MHGGHAILGLQISSAHKIFTCSFRHRQQISKYMPARSLRWQLVAGTENHMCQPKTQLAANPIMYTYVLSPAHSTSLYTQWLSKQQTVLLWWKFGHVHQSNFHIPTWNASQGMSNTRTRCSFLTVNAKETSKRRRRQPSPWWCTCILLGYSKVWLFCPVIRIQSVYCPQKTPRLGHLFHGLRTVAL